VPSLSTNSGAPTLAFQEWRHFKEAFAPELVARAVYESRVPVVRCLDPFGGSGTTAIACQFLGVEPVSVEVNPYLADLIDAKLVSYDPDSLVRDLGRVLRTAIKRRQTTKPAFSDAAPATMVEPGFKGRWVFDYLIAQRIEALLAAIRGLENDRHERLFRVLLGSILLDVSNVVVNGKGRRYRQHWKERRREPRSVEVLFSKAVRRAVSDIHRFGNRPQLTHRVIRGDARQCLDRIPTIELAVFSPPYPNSFDYTDVYNLELWVLGYLGDRPANRKLRQATLCSHVQIDRPYSPPPESSPTLDHVLDALRGRSDRLWHRRIPDMVGGYFADLIEVLTGIRASLDPCGSVWLVVGDSRYADVVIPTATVLNELVDAAGYSTESVEPFRSMRSSAQQGGVPELAETLMILTPMTSQ